MRKIKQLMKIILMFLILFAMVLAPLLYAAYQNEHMLNKTSVFPVKEVQLYEERNEIENYNIWEHIRITGHSIVIRSAAFGDFTQSQFTDGGETDLRETELLHIMEEQLAKLCEYRALPEISFSGKVKISIYKEIYMDQSVSGSYSDLSDSRMTTAVWAICAEDEELYIQAYMDTETTALYDIAISSKNNDLIYQSSVSGNGFLEYLKNFSDIPDDHEVFFSGNGFYSEREIQLYLSSIDENGKAVSYRFLRSETGYDSDYPLNMMIDAE